MPAEEAWKIVTVGGAVGVLFLWVGAFLTNLIWTRHAVNSIVASKDAQIAALTNVVEKMGEPIRTLAGEVKVLGTNQERQMDYIERQQTSLERIQETLSRRA